MPSANDAANVMGIFHPRRMLIVVEPWPWWRVPIRYRKSLYLINRYLQARSIRHVKGFAYSVRRHEEFLFKFWIVADDFHPIIVQHRLLYLENVFISSSFLFFYA